MDKTSSNPTRSGTMTRQQIAQAYGFSIQTLRRRLQSRNIELPPGLLGPKWQKVIFEAIGYPPGISRQEFEGV